MARTRSGYPPALIATAVALPVALVVGVVVAGVLAQRSPVREPVALTTVPAPQADSAQCATVLTALPDPLDDAPRAPLADPSPPGAAAWYSDGAEPIVLRCGIPRPLEFRADSALVGVDGVQWLEIPGDAQGIAATTYVAVDRGPYLALTLPDGAGSGALQQLAEVVGAALPARPLDPAPIGG